MRAEIDIFARLTLVAGFQLSSETSSALTQHEHKQDTSGPAASAQPDQITYPKSFCESPR